MSSSDDPIKILASRFVSLSPQVRMAVAEKLLRWHDEHRAAKATEGHGAPCSCMPKKSFLEQFWDEVEAAHGDGLYPSNPFAGERPQLLVYAVEDEPEPCPAQI